MNSRCYRCGYTLKRKRRITMAKRFYEDNESNAKQYLFDRVSTHEIFCLILFVISFAMIMSVRFFHQNGLMDFASIIRFSALIIIVIAACYFSIINLVLFSRLYTHKKGRTLKTLMDEYFIKKSIEKTFCDIQMSNPQKGSKGFLIPDIFVDLDNTKDELNIKFECLAGMKDFESIADDINASLNGKFAKYKIYKMLADETGNYFNYYLEDALTDKRFIPKTIEELIPNNPYEYRLQKNLAWNIAKQPHGMISGKTKSGKTSVILSIIIQQLLVGADIYIIDPKNEFSAFSFLGQAHIVNDKDSASILLNHAVTLMNTRQIIITEEVRKRGMMGLTGADLNMRPLFIYCDEMGSIVSQFNDTKSKKEFMGYFQQLVFMGRSALTNIVLATQQPNSNVTGTDLRLNLSLKMLLGSSTPELKQMVFGTNTDSVESNVENLQGYYHLDGETVQPQKIKVIDLHKHQLNALDVFKEAYERGKNTVYDFDEYKMK